MIIIPASCFCYHLTITSASHFDSLKRSMLDSIQHVRVILKHLHSLQADFEDRQAQGDISTTRYGHPHAYSKWYYVISPSGAEALTACGVKLPLSCTIYWGGNKGSGILTVIFLSQPPPVLP